MVKLMVNGEFCEVMLLVDILFLYVLCNEFNVMSFQFGCGLVQCGVCLVLFNGCEICFCIILVIVCVGSEVMILEGLFVWWQVWILMQNKFDGDILYLVQQVWIEQ